MGEQNPKNRPDPGKTSAAPSPLRDTRSGLRRTVIGHHIILHAYGHWLPNDPRGSGSENLRAHKLADLGPIHPGRKRVQPPRSHLKTFHDAAKQRLDFPILWFDDAKRQAVADAFARVITAFRYTVWGCAVLSNHAHLCVRRHRSDALKMWHHFAQEFANLLRVFPDVREDHPVWSSRPYKVFLYTPNDVRRVVNYITENPIKESLPAQHWAFVKPYDNWPHHRKAGP